MLWIFLQPRAATQTAVSCLGSALRAQRLATAVGPPTPLPVQCLATAVGPPSPLPVQCLATAVGPLARVPRDRCSFAIEGIVVHDTHQGCFCLREPDARQCRVCWKWPACSDSQRGLRLGVGFQLTDAHTVMTENQPAENTPRLLLARGNGARGPSWAAAGVQPSPLQWRGCSGGPWPFAHQLPEAVVFKYSCAAGHWPSAGSQSEQTESPEGRLSSVQAKERAVSVVTGGAPPGPPGPGRGPGAGRGRGRRRCRPCSGAQLGKALWGVAVVLCVCASWAGSTQLAKLTFRTFDAPFTLTWFATNWNFLFFPLYYAGHACQSAEKQSVKQRYSKARGTGHAERRGTRPGPELLRWQCPVTDTDSAGETVSKNGRSQPRPVLCVEQFCSKGSHPEAAPPVGGPGTWLSVVVRGCRNGDCSRARHVAVGRRGDCSRARRVAVVVGTAPGPSAWLSVIVGTAPGPGTLLSSWGLLRVPACGCHSGDCSRARCVAVGRRGDCSGSQRVAVIVGTAPGPGVWLS
ncbi:Solute carrier family 35 member F3 [Tupaia chinensis]|uniref:Solute carrier family 35 member F3 n=1 Tax=Tupaia chinensis TaxID=246437 RepID=L9L072_TUPCH|nr:Solute carrier family 35 member F3 [Tupaia chinensis]